MAIEVEEIPQSMLVTSVLPTGYYLMLLYNG